MVAGIVVTWIHGTLQDCPYFINLFGWREIPIGDGLHHRIFWLIEKLSQFRCTSVLALLQMS